MTGKQKAEEETPEPIKKPPKGTTPTVKAEIVEIIRKPDCGTISTTRILKKKLR